MISFNLSIGPLPRTKISIFLLLTCAHEPLFATKITRFLPNLPSANKNVACPANLIP